MMNQNNENQTSREKLHALMQMHQHFLLQLQQQSIQQNPFMRMMLIHLIVQQLPAPEGINFNVMSHPGDLAIHLCDHFNSRMQKQHCCCILQSGTLYVAQEICKL